MIYQLRPYQTNLIDGIYHQFQAGITRVIAWAQTGAGKTICFCHITKEAYERGLPVVIVMRRRKLIKQTSKKLDEFGIPHGIYMANHHRKDPSKLVQVCSIDTLSARDLYPHEDKEHKLICIDESHDVTPKAKKYSNLIERYSKDYIVGFTATPFSDNSYWQAIVKPIEAHELRDIGHLVPERTWAPSIIDTSGVKITNGEFNEKELFEVSATKEVIGDCVRDWKLYAQNRPTFLFAINVKHSEKIRDAFIEEGIVAAHMDANTKDRDREEMYRKLIKGEIKIITNVDINSTGVDVPEVSCIQICRPTQSLIWHLQAIGRGLRTAPGKENCIIIDNAGNTLRHGTAYQVRTAEIGPPAKRTKVEMDEEKVGIKRCKECLIIYESAQEKCPNCGYVNPKVERVIREREGDLVEHQISEEEKQVMIKHLFIGDYYKLRAVAKRTDKITDRYKKTWTWTKLQEKYGIKVFHDYKHLIEHMEF